MAKGNGNGDNRQVDLLVRIAEELERVRDEVTGVRDEVAGVRAEVSTLRGDLSGLRGEVSHLRHETHEQISGLRAEMKRGFEAVNQRLDGVLLIAGTHHRELERRVEAIEARLGPSSSAQP